MDARVKKLPYGVSDFIAVRTDEVLQFEGWTLRRIDEVVD